MESKKILQSYAFYNEKCFFISTILRQYSSNYLNLNGHETHVFEFDIEKKELGKLIYEGSEVDDHFNIFKDLIETGRIGERYTY